MKKRFGYLLLSSLFGASLLSGCGGAQSCPAPDFDEKEVAMRATYDNKFDESAIPGQWSDYGVGDPFVYRYNGKYYLYASTKNNEIGVRGWESEDLLHWSKLTGEGMNEGYVSMDECTVTAYAPEVIYYNGAFYMVESQSGNGHYLLRAEKPEGPFVAISGNFGESIDGSFFLDDDEQLYLLRASNTGIRLVKLDDDFSVADSRTLDNTQLGGWTEGPYLLKRDGVYYLTYTGNNVVSDGYRVAYSYNSGDVLFNRSGFEEGGTILLDTSEEFKGLGHSSTVLGPNLDTYYIAYHNLNSSGGPNRSFNLDALSFNGTDMAVPYAAYHDNQAPELPEFSSSGAASLNKSGDFLLSDRETGERFSAEYNFKGADSRMVFGYLDASNYSYVRFDGSKLEALKVKEGRESALASITMSKSYDPNVLHTIRVASDRERTAIYIDGMNKINLKEGGFAGKIGYKANEEDIFASSFSSHSFGSADKEDVHQGKILANSYYDSSFSQGSGLIETAAREEEDFNWKLGSSDMLLSKSGDYASYKIWVKEDGYYGLGLTMDKQYAGKKIAFQIDGGPIIHSTIASSHDAPQQYCNLLGAEASIKAGAHRLRVLSDGDAVAFSRIELFKSSEFAPSFEDSLSDYVAKGSRYVTTWRINNGGHYALSGNRNLLYLGDDSFTDVTIEADIELVGDTQTSSCGVIARAKNPAFGSSDDGSSIQGYYAGFNNSKAFISRCNYNNSDLDASADAHRFVSGVPHHLVFSIHGNAMTLEIDGEVSLDYVDSLGLYSGSIGLYTDGAAAIYRNLKIHA